MCYSPALPRLLIIERDFQTVAEDGGVKNILLLMVLSILIAGAEEDEQIRFSLEQRHIDQLRKVKVSWDSAETGAPCLSPSGSYPKELLYALQIAFLFGELKPGPYLYKKPRGELMEYSLMIEEMPTSTKFHFSPDHRQLLRKSAIEESEVGWDGETVPGCDPKRPYGDLSYYELEMAQHLGRPTRKNQEGHLEIDEQTEEELTRLHHSMQAAWQVFLENFELQPGTFVGDQWGNWERI